MSFKLSNSCNVKNFYKLIFILLVINYFDQTFSAVPYDYNSLSAIGPQLWSQVNSACGGKRQSPIDIKTSDLVRAKYPCDLQVSNTESRIAHVKFELKDYSIHIELYFENDQAPILSGGPLTDGNFYRFLSYHYHWGILDNEGSEHTINGNTYSIEGHFIFINLKYKTLEEAVTQPDGLAVIGQLFEVDNNASSLELIEYLPVFVKAGVNSTTFQPPKPVSFSSIFGHNPFIYAYYEGSLTTPPCSEAVSWFVSLKIYKISPEQIQAFRDLIDRNDLVASYNFRQPQPLNGRTVILGRAKVDPNPTVCSSKQVTAPDYHQNNFVRRNLRILRDESMLPFIS